VIDDQHTPEAWLADRHRDHLHRNGIRDAVIEGRPYVSIDDAVREQLRSDWRFPKEAVTASGFVIQRHRLGAEPVHPQIRYDVARVSKDGKEHQYYSPKNSGGVLDVHPAAAHLLSEVEIPLWVAESVKGADALFSHGHLAVGFQGVWGWSYCGRPAPDWTEIPLRGREVYIVFDSDVHDRNDLRTALRRFANFLKYEREAVVYVAQVPQPGEPKVGVDDHYGARDMGVSTGSADAADAADAVFNDFSRAAGGV
jgi:hypothetical protein